MEKSEASAIWAPKPLLRSPSFFYGTIKKSTAIGKVHKKTQYCIHNATFLLHCTLHIPRVIIWQWIESLWVNGTKYLRNLPAQPFREFRLHNRRIQTFPPLLWYCTNKLKKAKDKIFMGSIYRTFRRNLLPYVLFLTISFFCHTANEGPVRIQYNVWFRFMFSQIWNWAASLFPNQNYNDGLLIFTFMYLCSIYILPRSVCLGPIVGIYKSLTDTWMLKLVTRLRRFISRNIYLEFSVQTL